MKPILFFILLFPLACIGQDNDIRKFGTLDFIGGLRIYSAGFYNQLNTFDYTQISHPLQIAGIGGTSYINVNRSSTWPGQISYLRVIPQRIKIQDTINARITGGIFSIPFFGLDVFKKVKWMSLLLNAGLNAGQLKIYGNDLVRQRNPFTSPYLSLMPRFKIGPVVLALLGSYEYDISSPRWKRRWFAPKNKITLDHLRQSGMTVFISLGILFPEA